MSAWHVSRPADACSQTRFASERRETTSHPSPAAVLHIESEVQKRGQLDACAHTLPAPKSQHA